MEERDKVFAEILKLMEEQEAALLHKLTPEEAAECELRRKRIEELFTIADESCELD